MVNKKSDKLTNVLTTFLGIIGFFGSFYFADDWKYLLTGTCISIILVIYKSKAGAFLKRQLDKFNK